MINIKNPDQLQPKNMQLQPKNMQLQPKNMQLRPKNMLEEKVIHNNVTSVLNNQVAFSNSITRSYQYLTLQEKKLFILAASKLKVGLSPDGTMFPLLQTFNERTVTVTAKEFAEFCKITLNDSYQKLNKSANSLLSKSTIHSYFDTDTSVYPPTQEERTIKFNWLECYDYPKGSASVEMTFTSLLMQQALQVYENFSTYHLHEIFNLKTYYAVRFHEIFNSYKAKTSFTPIDKIFTLLELKEMLGAPKSYIWDTFKKKCLEPALVELRENALWDITYKQIKTGRAVTGLKFTIKKLPS